MKKILLTALIVASSQIFSQAVKTIPTLTLAGFTFSNQYAGGQLTGTLTSVQISGTLSASVAATYANDLTVYVTSTSTLAGDGPLQVGGDTTATTVGERAYWSNGGSATVGTVLNDTYTLVTPLNFTTHPTYNVWLGNGYSNSTGAGIPSTNSGTWTSITATLNGVTASSLGATDITLKSDVGVTVYPNPVSDFVNVTSKDSKINLVSIMDLSGRAVKTVLTSDKRTEISVDVSELSSGNYLLIIDTDKGKFSKKFIKK